MNEPDHATSRHPPLKFERNLALIFAILGILVITLITLHWFLILEPTLRADARSHCRILAQAQANGIEQRLDGGQPDLLRGELETALDNLLLLKDPATGLPFVLRATLRMDYGHMDALPGSLDMDRGVGQCPECLVSDIPLYRPGDRQRIGTATFYTSPNFLNSMVADFRAELLWGGGFMLGVIALAWVGSEWLLRRLAESEANLRNLFEATHIPMVLHDSGQTGLTWANQAAKDYLALREDATGSYASDAWRAMEAFGLPADAAERRETRIHTEEGVERWALVSTTTLRISGRPSQLVSLVDVSELKAIQSELLVASLTDGLTGLYNRRYLFLKLAEEIERARRFAYGFSIALFDLDHFKGVNDTFGHRVGDEVLIRVATELRRSIREVDFAGRYGGEEFLVILPYANTAVALDVAERIRAGIDALTWSKPGLRVTLSGGVCEYAGTDIDTLVDAADRRLYEAKAAGRDRVIG